MQKKFLRTSVLTLVMGLSLLTASHAMAPDGDETKRVKITARISNYQKEATKCEELPKRGPDGIFPKLKWKGQYSGLVHEREATTHMLDWRGTQDSLTYRPGCSGCETLELTALAMRRDEKVYEARDFN